MKNNSGSGNPRNNGPTNKDYLDQSPVLIGVPPAKMPKAPVQPPAEKPNKK